MNRSNKRSFTVVDNATGGCFNQAHLSQQVTAQTVAAATVSNQTLRQQQPLPQQQQQLQLNRSKKMYQISTNGITITKTMNQKGHHRHLINQYLLMFISLLSALSHLYLVAAQCPWTRESVELHSDCICDFNPSSSNNNNNNLDTQAQPPVSRMSVQCSPVNFEQLIEALKQTASIELPHQLLKLPVAKMLSPAAEPNLENFITQVTSQAKLDLLHISNSSLGQLRDNTFIMDLTINNNNNSSIAPVDSNTTTQHRHLLVAIQSLHLSRCGLEKIQAQAFNGLEWSLTSLSLSDNELEFVPVSAISRLINLKVLDLSNNKIIQIPANSFATLNKLNTLRLADNRLSHKVDLMAFVGLEASLSDLNLKNAQLATFPLAIKSLRNLAFLNLAQNQISHVPPRCFEHINSLTAINLERNRISRIDNDTFLGVEQSLSSLSLLGNLLEAFPVQQLARLASIRRLDMGFNGIDSLPVEAFANNKKLILIALDGNPLDTLPEQSFKPLEGTLRGLSIGGKALNCDCRLSWMLRWQQEFNMQISSRERQPQFCAKPHYLRSLVSFSALKPEHLTCTSATLPAATYSPAIFASKLITNSSSSSLEHQPLYFTLPMLFNQDQTSATSSPPSVTAHHLLAKTPFELVTVASIQPQETTRSSSGRQSPAEVTGDGSVTGSSSTSTPASTDDSNAISESSMDLTEAATNEEPTLLSDDDGVTTASSLAAEFVPETTTVTRISSTSHLYNYGDRTNSNSGGLASATSNSLSSLPDDELFVTDSSKKLNRNGFLASQQQQHQKKHHSQVTATGGSSNLLNELLRHSTTAANMTKSQRTAAQSLINSLDLIRRNKTATSGHMLNSPVASGTAAPGATGEPGTRVKPITSVFGSRAAGERRSSGRGGTTTTQVVSSLSTGAGSSASSTGGFNPTTATGSSGVFGNVQKGARFVDETISSPLPTAHFSRSSTSPLPATPVSSTTTTTTSTTTTPQPTFTMSSSSSSRRPTTLSPNFELRLVDTDIERYAIAASNINSRVSGSSLQPAIPTSESVGTNPTLLSVAFDSNKIETTTMNPQMTVNAARQAFANNTRMSVSSMYRLATGVSGNVASAARTTTATPIYRTSLEAAAEDASHKITRTVSPSSSSTTTSTSTTTTTTTTAAPRSLQQQVVVTTRAADFRRLSTSGSSDTSPPVTLQQSVGKAWQQTVKSTTTTAQASSPQTTPTHSSTTTTRPPLIEPAVVTTTRMASTVRIVESPPPIVRYSAGNVTHSAPIPDLQPTVGVATLTRHPHSVVAPVTTRPLLFVGEQQHEARLTLTGGSGGVSVLQRQQPVLVSSGEQVVNTSPPTGAMQTTAQVQLGDLLTTREWHQQQHHLHSTQQPGQRQPKLEADHSNEQQPSQPANHLPRTFFGKLVHLSDFDQVALVLASLLCLFILILALTVVGVCCSSTCCSASDRRTAGLTTGGCTSHLASFSSTSGKAQHQQRQKRSNGRNNLLSRWLCCWLSGKRRLVTPMRSLILANDDDNSSGSGGSSNGNKSTGKSMLLAPTTNCSPATSSVSSSVSSSLNCGQDLLVESIRKASMRVATKGGNAGNKQLKSKAEKHNAATGKRRKRDIQVQPIDHEASIERHRLAHALEQQEYFVGVSRSVGRRQSMVVQGGNRLMTNSRGGQVNGGDETTITSGQEDEWVRDDALSSCDSDKSCSPGANRNNRYNISEAHRAYLAGGNKQVQASMFVTTSSSGGSPPNKNGLLKTIDNRHSSRHAVPEVDYLERLSRISSDKSTTDDSRAPLASRMRTEYRAGRLCTMRPTTSKSFGQQQQQTLHRSRSIGRLPANELSYPAGNVQQLGGSSLTCGDLLSSDLVPMSAEEQWPEPYVDPDDTGAEQQQQMSLGNAPKLSEQFAPYRFEAQQQHLFHQHSGAHTLARNQRGRLNAAGSAHRVAQDDAYLANWHTMSRTATSRPNYTSTREQSSEQRGSANYHNQNHHYLQQQQQQQQSADAQQHSTLIRYRSIPNSLNGNNQQPQHLLAAQVPGGATNWLRWTPNNFMQSNAAEQQVTAAVAAGEATGGSGRGWHRDNHVEAVYIAANQQR